jgi:hypothetical protein
MSAWPLQPLGRLRSAQALHAARDAAVRWKEAARSLGLAEEIAARAAEGRRQAAPAQEDAAALAVDLARGVSSRATADGTARRTAREGMQAAQRAERVKDRAEEAMAVACQLRGRADALARGAGRWAERGRRTLAARREREVEEAWSGARREARDC